MELRSSKKNGASTSQPPTFYRTDLIDGNQEQPEPEELFIGVDASDVEQDPESNQRPSKRRCGQQCSFCGKNFRRKDTLCEHVRTHTREQPYACVFCTLRFPTKSTRQKHERSHVGDKRYSCSQCGLAFSGKPSLNYHLMAHSGEQPYKCQFCGKGFIQKSTLKRHLVVHSGAKPFSCHDCGRPFARSTSLKSHSCTRKDGACVFYHCQHCSKTLESKDSFEYHLKTHVGSRPFPCSVCALSFIKRAHLQRHMLKVHRTPYKTPRTNSGVKAEGGICSRRSSHRLQYSCSYCPNQFYHRQGLESHLKVHVSALRSRTAELGDGTIGEKPNDGFSSDDNWLPTQNLCEVVLGAEDSPPRKKINISRTAHPRKCKRR